MLRYWVRNPRSGRLDLLLNTIFGSHAKKMESIWQACSGRVILRQHVLNRWRGELYGCLIYFLRYFSHEHLTNFGWWALCAFLLDFALCCACLGKVYLLAWGCSFVLCFFWRCKSFESYIRCKSWKCYLALSIGPLVFCYSFKCFVIFFSFIFSPVLIFIQACGWIEHKSCSH